MSVSEVDQLAEAAGLTQRLVAAVPPDSDFDSVWDVSGEVLQKLEEAGYSPEEFLPTEIAGQLNFNAPGLEAGRRFFRSYAREVRNAVCGEGELRTSIQNAMASGVGSLLTALAGTLTIPLGAVTLLAPIAAILLVKGIDAFCNMNAKDVAATSATGSSSL